jgi:plastocyanin
MSSRCKWGLGAVAALGLVAPGTAQAASKTVLVGTPPTSGKAFQKYGADVNAYFPSSIAIHRGDSVKFQPVGFHDVHFLGSKGKQTTPFVPTGKTIAGVNDAAGIPFWFNGQPELGPNPNVFTPNGKLGKTVITDGTKEIFSGAPLSDKPKPMTVRFTKAGLFRYYCSIHPGMKGAVRVAAKNRPVPSAAADARRVKTQVAKALTVAKSLGKASVPTNTLDVGRAGPGGVSMFAFLPAKRTVPVGTTMTFRMQTGDFETHTVTAGPGDPSKDPKSYLGALTASLESPAARQEALYPSDLPVAPAALTPALHGNGFWNSGGMDPIAASPLPQRTSVTFAAAGTYTLYCLIHPFMKATVTAQ